MDGKEPLASIPDGFGADEEEVPSNDDIGCILCVDGEGSPASVPDGSGSDEEEVPSDVAMGSIPE